MANRSINRWSTAVAAAALFALPVGAAAQTTPTQQPPTQPTQQPTTQPPPMQPAPTQQTSPSQPSQATGQVDAAAAKQHLSDARDALSQITSMPEAAKLQGDARTQVSQLISNFNELITTQSNWRASYDKVAANLTSLIGPDSSDATAAAGGTGAVGTSGTAGAAGSTGSTGSTGTSGTGSAAGAGSTGAGATTGASVDPAIRAKLAEFRTHLKLFEQSAGGGSASHSGDAMSPSAATGSTSNPANPASAAASTDPSQPPTSGTSGSATTSAGSAGTSGATGTSGVSGAAGTAGTSGTSGATGTSGMTSGTAQPSGSGAADHAAADKHLDAISAILNKSRTGTLTKAQTAELKKHVAELRRLLQNQ